MNGSWIEPPPPSGMGCFAKGCLTLAAFFIFLGLAFLGGTFFAVRYLRVSYFPTHHVELPAVTATDEEQQTAKAHWDSFERAAHGRTPARLEMTADELNALIASEPKLRGRAYISIEHNVARLQVSIPLNETRLLRGHYMNADCSVESADDGNPEDARITGIIVNGRPVGDEVLNWRGPWSLRRYISDWTARGNLKTLEIEDGKVILETRGSE